MPRTRAALRVGPAVRPARARLALGRPTRRSAAAACGSAPRRLGQAHPGSKALGGVQPCFFSKPFLGALLACISPPTAILSGSFSPGSTRGTAPAAAAMPQDFQWRPRTASACRRTRSAECRACGVSRLRPRSSRGARPHCPLLEGWPERPGGPGGGLVRCMRYCLPGLVGKAGQLLPTPAPQTTGPTGRRRLASGRQAIDLPCPIPGAD